MKVVIILTLLVLCTLSVDAQAIAKSDICSPIIKTINELLDTIGSVGTILLNTLSAVFTALIEKLKEIPILNRTCLDNILLSLLIVLNTLVKALNECLLPAIAALKAIISKACEEMVKALTIVDDITKCLQNPLMAVPCLTALLPKILALPGALLAAINAIVTAVGVLVKALADCLTSTLAQLGPQLTAALGGLTDCLLP